MKSVFKYFKFMILLVQFCAAEYFDIIKTVTKNGYPIEAHEIETEDSYFLVAHRISHGRRNVTKSPNKYPVVVVHGLGANGDWFVLLGPEKGMGYVLADNGYDVWLCNVRGAIHSRKHKSLNADEGTLFWKFSWHEIGLYDLPAMIDYVLNVTNKDKVHYVGHSQGGTSFFVMISERPEYNEKIKIMIGLSPAVFITKVPNHFYRLIMPFVPILQAASDILGIYDLLALFPYSFRNSINPFCGPNSPTNILQICKDFLSVVAGSNDDQLELDICSYLYVMAEVLVFHKEAWDPREDLGRLLLHPIKWLEDAFQKEFPNFPKKARRRFQNFLGMLQFLRNVFSFSFSF